MKFGRSDFVRWCEWSSFALSYEWIALVCSPVTWPFTATLYARGRVTLSESFRERIHYIIIFYMTKIPFRQWSLYIGALNLFHFLFS